MTEIVCEPTPRTVALVVTLALPLVSETVPSVTPLVVSLNVTVPVGVGPEDEGVTLAVKVTPSPNTDGLMEVVRTEVLAEPTELTICDKVSEFAERKFVLSL